MIMMKERLRFDHRLAFCLVLNAFVKAQVAAKPSITGYQKTMITCPHSLLQLDTFYRNHTDGFGNSVASSAEASNFALLTA
jgi:hypothetical protein